MNATRQLDPEQKENARTLRKNLAPAEKILWKALRNRRFAGFKFRRQHPVGAYIVDFICLEIKLGVELDGESHLNRKREDEQRQQWLESQGIKLIRFWNSDVFEDCDVVQEAIWRECMLRQNEQ